MIKPYGVHTLSPKGYSFKTAIHTRESSGDTRKGSTDLGAEDYLSDDLRLAISPTTLQGKTHRRTTDYRLHTRHFRQQ